MRDAINQTRLSPAIKVRPVIAEATVGYQAGRMVIGKSIRRIPVIVRNQAGGIFDAKSVRRIT
jgi:hypothetical protein